MNIFQTKKTYQHANDIALFDQYECRFLFRQIKHSWDMNHFENSKVIATLIDSLNQNPLN